MIEIERLLEPVSPEASCGENLEYDAEYGELERATEGKPEQQFGDHIMPAEEPDWLDVERRALALLGRTKDLRIVLPLLSAVARTQGWTGFRDGLALLRGLLERYWDSIHPELDPDDDNDPTLRVNTIAALCDPERMLAALRAAPLVQSRTFGRFSLRDMQQASGELPSPGGEAPDMQAIGAACMDADLEDLRATANAVNQAIELVAGIESLLLERVGSSQAPDLDSLTGLLKTAQRAVADPLSRRIGTAAEAHPRAIESAAAAADPAAAGAPAAAAVIGPVRSREDAVRVLEAVCDYYARQEPSSPVPILLRRAQRLVSKDFVEIVRDLAPDGISQIETIRGPQDDAS